MFLSPKFSKTGQNFEQYYFCPCIWFGTQREPENSSKFTTAKRGLRLLLYIQRSYHSFK